MSNKKPNEINISGKDDKEINFKSALACISPSVHAALVIRHTGKDFNPHIDMLMKVLDYEANNIKKGDLSGIENMLITQAYTLQSIFTETINKAFSSEYSNHLQIYSKIALKAQNQCRQTLAVLAEMKNPHRTTFIKNQATNQQVNLNQPQTSPEKNQNKSNELLSEEHYAPMDITGTPTPSEVNQEMATVEA